MQLEEIAFYGSSIGGLLVIIAFVVFWIVAKQAGETGHANEIFLKVYRLMFSVLAIFILSSVVFNLGEKLTGHLFQQVSLTVFSIATFLGAVYLLILNKTRS
ncbi:hypothetical protein [Halalkalibacterium halodurans]|uniref:DUF2178 domain-containing protein n=1 Tax=Halalkalibacterium halodurans TaxID=86665 RepID=A0A0M0KEY6_ALKHA|nr:hypothetical protein [Halalkalibacterium halodurans]MDY7220945.1 hypothetical protein [Halalkalibacterium halodurans]MDY7240184.1 hypothetical protein [Halalkalibacterium halodurans]MED4164224.1 hypothetical protein [Halalkalibacterium halodurans]TPE69761.1 hypothetical protein AMD02_006300 [Halalkalibacterium halodurans]